MTKKQSIDFVLREILRAGTIGTHEEIVRALNKRGYTVNQSKISRLLHKLGAVKVTNELGEAVYRLPHEHALLHEINVSTSRLSLKSLLIDIVNNESLIVINTIPSAAHLIAREIDMHRSNLGILGTIAGDDTVLVIPESTKHIKRVIENLRDHL